jgi:hypothetical protein
MMFADHSILNIDTYHLEYAFKNPRNRSCIVCLHSSRALISSLAHYHILEHEVALRQRVEWTEERKIKLSYFGRSIPQVNIFFLDHDLTPDSQPIPVMHSCPFVCANSCSTSSVYQGTTSFHPLIS